MTFFFTATPSEEEIYNLLGKVNMAIKANMAISKASSFDQNHIFLQKLSLRLSEYKNELTQINLATVEKDRILIQYHKFSKTLLNCIENPNNAANSIAHYMNGRYYPVGISEYTKPDPLLMDISWGALGVGIALLLSSIPAFVLNPVLGAVMLATATTILLPSIFCLLAPESPDVLKKKDEEKELFIKATQLINPSVVFDDQDHLDQLNVNDSNLILN